DEVRELKAEHAKQSREGLKTVIERLIEAAQKDEPPLVVAEVTAQGVDEMREAGDLIRRKLPHGGGLLAAAIEGKLSVVASVGTGLQGALAASDWAKAAVAIVEGKGGGRPDQAGARARDATHISAVLEGV